MIDLRVEELLPLREVPRRLPIRPSGKKLHVSAVYRWASRGVRGVRLETTRVGGTTYTSAEALQRFSDALNGRSVSATVAPEPTRARERQVQAATKRLDELLGGAATTRA